MTQVSTLRIQVVMAALRFPWTNLFLTTASGIVCHSAFFQAIRLSTVVRDGGRKEAHDWGSSVSHTRIQAKIATWLTVSSIDFTDSDFAEFTLGTFVECDFQRANFKNAVKLNIHSNHGVPVPFGFRNCNITKEQIEQTRFWKEGNLRGIILEDMNLDGWDFSNKDLTYASLKGSSVRGSNFENAIILGTNFSNSLGLTAEQIRSMRNFQEKWLETMLKE